MHVEVKNNVIKRNGQEVSFNIDKIIHAVQAANCEVAPSDESLSDRGDRR